MQEKFHNDKWTLVIQEGLPNDAKTRLCLALANALVNNDFTEFESMLSRDAQWVNVFNETTIPRKSSIVDYWKEWVEKTTDSGVEVMLEVKFCSYYFCPALAIHPKDGDTTYTLFCTDEDGKIRKGVTMNALIARYYNNPSCSSKNQNTETLDKFPLLLKSYNFKELSWAKGKSNRIPCLRCGRKSESLSWKRVSYRSRHLEFSGFMSECPTCGKYIELVPDDGKIEYHSYLMSTVEDIKEEEEGKSDNLYKTSSTCFEFCPNLGIELCMPYRCCTIGAYLDPLSRSKKYIPRFDPSEEAERTSPYDIASSFDLHDLEYMHWKHIKVYKKIKQCFENALNGGAYEAANSLAVLAYDVERNKDEALAYLRIGQAHGSETALLNLVHILWEEQKYEEVKRLLTDNNCRDPYNQEEKFFYRFLRSGILLTTAIGWCIDVNNMNLTPYLPLLLPEIKLVEGWYLSIKKEHEITVSYRSQGDTCFCAVNANNCASHVEGLDFVFDGERDTDVWKYVIMPKSKKAIWELYLLMTADAVLAYYSRRIFLFEDSDFDHIYCLKDRDMRMLKGKGLTHPTVEIEDIENGFLAHVYCCTWRKIHSKVSELMVKEHFRLVKEHVIIKVQGDRVVEYTNAPDLVFFKCDGGTIFY